ncbi:hypothetical protein BV20DRAFT_902720, partial [Pilatotrama ljubarskyi]
MALSACSRRLSGTVRSRALSVSASGGHAPGLRTSSTLSSLDNLCGDVAMSVSGQDNALDTLQVLSSSTLGPPRKGLNFATLGRARPARRSQDAENDTESAFPRKPSAGTLWRPGVLCSST